LSIMARRLQPQAKKLSLTFASWTVCFWSSAMLGNNPTCRSTPHGGPCAILSNDLETQKKVRKGSSHRRLTHRSGQMLRSSQYDTNAIGESWKNTAMHVWADRTGSAAAPAAKLEEKLVAMKIGGVSGREGHREASRLQRLARQRAKDAAKQSTSQAHHSTFLCRGDDVALPSKQHDVNAIAKSWVCSFTRGMEPSELEDQLASMKIGGLSITEGKREVARRQRADKQQAFDSNRNK